MINEFQFESHSKLFTEVHPIGEADYAKLIINDSVITFIHLNFIIHTKTIAAFNVI